MSDIAKLSELSGDVEKDFKNDQFNLILNKNPKPEWVKQHPYINNHSYVPIDKVEWMLKFFFRQYKIEVLKTGMLMNSVECTVRVHVLNPVTEEWIYHDGVGAQELQTKKDSGHLLNDMSNIQRGAVSMALPIAKSIAIKDACDHLGRIFGADINRKDIAPFSTDVSTKEAHESTIRERIQKAVDNAESPDDLLEILNQCPDEHTDIVKEAIENFEGSHVEN